MDPLATIASLLPLADSFDGHHGWGSGWWVLMGLGMLLFWGLVIAGGIWLAREFADRRRDDRGRPTALDTLDQRLAEGAISVEQYEERRTALRDAQRETGGADG
jgi:putative membrane protein